MSTPRRSKRLTQPKLVRQNAYVAVTSDEDEELEEEQKEGEEEEGEFEELGSEDTSSGETSEEDEENDSDYVPEPDDPSIEEDPTTRYLLEKLKEEILARERDRQARKTAKKNYLKQQRQESEQ